MPWRIAALIKGWKFIQLNLWWLRARVAAHQAFEKAMAGAVPQSKNQVLTDRINLMARKRIATGKYDQWEWHALKRDVEAFANTSGFEAEGLLLLSVVWGMANNATEMDRCLKVYAGKFGKTWPWHRARAQQGPTFGRLDTVMDMLKYGYPKGDLPNMYFVARVCNQSGLFRTTAETLQAAEGLSGNLPADELNHYAHLPAVLRYMDENAVDEKIMAERIACASQVVMRMVGSLSSFEVYGSDVGITFDYTVAADIELLVDIDFAISEALAEKFEDTYARHLSIGVTPAARTE